MKVALVHHRLTKHGGLEARLRNYMKYFSEKGHDVDVFCYKYDHDIKLPKRVEVIKLELGLMPKPYRRWYFNKKVQKAFDPNAYDFSLSLERTEGQMACLAPGDHRGFMRAMNKPIIRLKDLLQVRLDKYAFGRAKVIFPCSDWVRQNLIDYYDIPEEKMITLYPPLNVEQFSALQGSALQEAKKKWNMKADKMNFGIVSTSHKRKGIPFLLKLFKELGADFQLYIAGKPKVKAHSDNVHYVGYVEKVQDFYSALDFTIHPSLFEPYGQVIAESLACETPVIISENTGWSKILAENQGRVVEGFEIDVWANKIRELNPDDFSVNRDFIKRMGLSTEMHMQKMLEQFQL